MKCKLDATVVDDAIRLIYPNKNEKEANGKQFHYVFGTKPSFSMLI
jgi:hypothetical protein